MKSGYIGLVGLPNAGKSTLVNALIGEKVSIVSRKPQTTRKRVLGIYSDSDTQAIFLDAPGFIKADSGLNHFLQKELECVIEESDVLIAVLNLDCHQMESLVEIVELCQKSKKPWMVAMTKDDMNLLHRVEKLREFLKPYNVPVVVTSAIKRPSELKELILNPTVELLPTTAQPYYENEIFTTQTEREILAEMVREQCFEYLHEELPYGVAVRTTEFKDEPEIIRAQVEIVVSKENYVGMVVGQGGQTIKRIGASSRILAEKFFNKKLFIQTSVKCKKDWSSDEKFMKEMGYVIG